MPLTYKTTPTGYQIGSYSIINPPQQAVVISSIATNSGTYTGNRLSSASNNLQSGDGLLVGTSIYSGTNYNVFAFGQTSLTYTINYTCNTACNISVLAVGGGGSGIGVGTNGGGGGGAGGVAMTTISLAGNTTNTIVIPINADLNYDVDCQMGYNTTLLVPITIPSITENSPVVIIPIVTLILFLVYGFIDLSKDEHDSDYY